MQKRLLIFLAVAFSIVAADQWTKYLVVRDLTTQMDGRQTLSARLGAMYSAPPAAGPSGLHYRPTRHVDVSDQFFRLRYAENPGAAWGLFRNLAPNVRGPLFHVVSIGAIFLIGYYFIRLRGSRDERWALWGLPLVLGGAMGNYVDRIARGFVIDFLEAHWKDRMAWPSFNVADAAICVGVGFLVVDAFVRREVKSPALNSLS